MKKREDRGKKALDIPENFEDLNDSELRAFCEILSDRHLSPWTPRATLEEFLRAGKPLPVNPMDEVRLHQMTIIADNYALYRAQMPMPLRNGGICSGGCFDHDDIQVSECQLLTLAFRHKNYSEQTTRRKK